MAEQIVADQKEKPAFDEQTLQRLLEAAFVLQEHSNGLQTLGLPSDQLKEQEFVTHSQQQKQIRDDLSSRPDYTAVLPQIVEIQRTIQTRHLDSEKAMALIVDSIVNITKASGAAIAILEGKKVRYRAVSGSCALRLGSEVGVDKAICSACLRTGHVVRCADINSEFLVDVEECCRRGIHSLVAVPVYHEGKVIGALEIYFAETQGFTAQDVHACQLMAGLVTEVFARDSELTQKKLLAAQRATTSESVCPKCGHELLDEEQFCGRCGSRRTSVGKPSNLESKVSSSRQQSTKPLPPNGNSIHRDDRAAIDVHKSRVSSEPAGLPGIEELGETGSDQQKEIVQPAAAPSSVFTDTDGDTDFMVSGSEQLLPPHELEIPSEKTALARSQEDITWTSAANAREALEALAASRSRSATGRFWNARRGDVYLAIAVVLVGVVLRWGVWANNSVGATGDAAPGAAHHQKSPDADLTMFEKLLVSLGLAEAPDRLPEYKGNPDRQVWVDLHTALYYCPGSALYGKTEKGKLTSQRSAQLDSFEPASRKACD